MHSSRRAVLAAIALLTPAIAVAQSVDLTVHQTGLSIGDSRYVRGVRINFRDANLRQVDGVNITVWSPHSPVRSTINGVAIGLPLTGARNINGAGLGLFGVGAEGDFRGIGIGGLGVGAGGDVRGIVLGGLGVGSGGHIRGLTFGGLGVGSGGGLTGINLAGLGLGSGGELRGLSVAGLAVGSGADVSGITIGGLAVGGGGNFTGLQVGGLAVGGGGEFRGITIGGLAVGAGSELRGLQVGGVAVGSGSDVTGITVALGALGSGGTIRGLAIGGLAVGAPTMRAIVFGSAVGGYDITGGVLAPFYFRIESGDNVDLGRVKGVTISAFNHIKGEQFGLSIGLLNYAWELNGWQVGVLNYAGNNPKGLRLLPLMNRKW